PSLHRSQALKFSAHPMRRPLAQPLHAGVLHRHRRVGAFGDGVGDDGLALFLGQLAQALLLFDHRANAGGFVVEEAGDLGLLWKWRQGHQNILKIVPADSRSMRKNAVAKRLRKSLKFFLLKYSKSKSLLNNVISWVKNDINRTAYAIQRRKPI